MKQRNILPASILMTGVCIAATLGVSVFFLYMLFSTTDKNSAWRALAGVPVFGNPLLCILAYFIFCIVTCVMLIRLSETVARAHSGIDERPIYFSLIGDVAGLFAAIYLLAGPELGMAAGMILCVLVPANSALRLACLIHVGNLRRQREAEGVYSLSRAIEKSVVFPRIIHKKLLLALAVTGFACIGVSLAAFTLFIRAFTMHDDFIFLLYLFLEGAFLAHADICFGCILYHCIRGIRILSGKKFYRVTEPWQQALIVEGYCGAVGYGFLLSLSQALSQSSAVFPVAIAAVAVWALHFLLALAYTIVLMRMRKSAQKAPPADAPPREISENTDAPEVPVSADTPENNHKGESV